MTVVIEKIRLINYRRFEDYTIKPNERINILVGDNETGKSSILEAIDIVASGSVRKVESLGLDHLFNTTAIENFWETRKYHDLPKMIIELYLEGDFDYTMNGKNNSLNIVTDGIRLVCSPNEDYITEINEFLTSEILIFPYEYYNIRFSTFSDEGYSGYKRKLKTVHINNANLSSDYATNDFIERMYHQYTENDTRERIKHRSQYRQMKKQFCIDHLADLNERVPPDKNYYFALENNHSNIFSQDLMIYEDLVAINNKGTGRQVLIKTDFALEKAGENVDVILMEEPENHLSHGNLQRLVSSIAGRQDGQIFITTHNSLISTRLDLNNLIILSADGKDEPLYLHNLSKSTSNYFLKSPPASILEFTLSPKIILVEGPSEYILFDKLYESITGRHIDQDSIHVLAIRGLSFRRYLEVSRITKSKVAVVTDNDGDYQNNCIKKYEDFNDLHNIKIFYSKNNDRRTLEYHLLENNKDICLNSFGNNPLDYMLRNKTECALELSKLSNLAVPDYIREAIEWIRE